jgi:hypothetical protein
LPAYSRCRSMAEAAVAKRPATRPRAAKNCMLIGEDGEIALARVKLCGSLDAGLATLLGG